MVKKGGKKILWMATNPVKTNREQKRHARVQREDSNIILSNMTCMNCYMCSSLTYEKKRLISSD